MVIWFFCFDQNLLKKENQAIWTGDVGGFPVSIEENENVIVNSFTEDENIVVSSSNTIINKGCSQIIKTGINKGNHCNT